MDDASWSPETLAALAGALEVDVTTLGADGASQLVTFEGVDVDAPVQAEISATFLTKYAADGYASSMNEHGPLESTLRLIPR